MLISTKIIDKYFFDILSPSHTIVLFLQTLLIEESQTSLHQQQNKGSSSSMHSSKLGVIRQSFVVYKKHFNILFQKLLVVHETKVIRMQNIYS